MDRRIRVAMLIQRYHPYVGGAERQLRSLAPVLQESGVDLQVFTRRYDGSPAFELIDGVPVHRIAAPPPKPAASLFFTGLTLRELRKWRPDVIHAHGLFSATTTALLARSMLGTPVVAKALRGGDLGDIARLGRKLFGRRRLNELRTRVDAFAVISREIDDELAQIGIPAANREFIPNGIDPERFKPLPVLEKQKQKAVLGLSPGPLAIYVGRLVNEKRAAQLVEVWDSIRRSHTDATLAIVGTGPEEASLRASAGDGVRFFGAVDDVVPYLQAADLFVLPSAYEGLSNALLEALATGLPVVATNVGGASDLITNGVNGWLIPADEPRTLHQVLDRHLHNRDEWEQLGLQARARVEQDYALPAVADRLANLYRMLNSPARNPASSVAEARR